MPVLLWYLVQSDIMKAKFNTSCTSCGDQIKAGKEIARDQTGKWVHKYCAVENSDLP